MDSKTSNPPNVNLQWTFTLSKFLGISVLHTTTFHKFYSILIQCLCIPSLIIWCSNSGVFRNDLNGITKGVLHVVTTYSSVILVVRSWKQTNRVLKAINALNEFGYEIVHTKIDKVLSCLTIMYFLALICIDLELDFLTSEYLVHLQTWAFYVPLLQMMMVGNQFMGLVKHVDLCLSCLLKKLRSPDQSDTNELMKSYRQLHEVSKLIEEAFSLQNLILIMHHIFATTFSMYYFFEALLHLYPTNTVRKRLWLCLATSILYFSVIFLKFALCQTVQSKAKDFKETLYDEISSDPQVVQSLALQPLHKKIKFSAFDVVDMNYKALKAIVMTIVTYQVILLQFTVSNTPMVKNNSQNDSFPPQHNHTRS